MSEKISDFHCRSAAPAFIGPMIAALACLLGTQAPAASVPVGIYSYDSDFADIIAPVAGVASFTGANLVTPGAGVPIDNLDVTLASGLFDHQYSNVVFSIDSGFAELATFVFDLNANSAIDAGDSVLMNLGPGAFSFKQAGVLILGGTFSGGAFTGQIGGARGAAISSDTGALDLFPGPAFMFDNGTFVSQIGDAEGFAINLTSIPLSGIQAAPLADLGNGVFLADLLPFGVSNGSVNTSGIAVVVPEPSSWMLMGLGCLVLARGATLRRRRLAPTSR